MRRRLLIALLLVLALAGGLWWWSTRLNETERKLVGVWEIVTPEWKGAMFLLLNGRELVFLKTSGEWQSHNQSSRWGASPMSLWFRSQTRVPVSTSFIEWREFAMTHWYDKNRDEWRIARLTDDEIELNAGGAKVTYHRSTDPELLRLFEKLSAGESP